ncbi:hypothetical protein KC324_g75 [Hortaea werneckii]|nr:hypothetical protein KC324_g75 [Hortaea werneckii]
MHQVAALEQAPDIIKLPAVGDDGSLQTKSGGVQDEGCGAHPAFDALRFFLRVSTTRSLCSRCARVMRQVNMKTRWSRARKLSLLTLPT